jgi:hypothetical protein
MPVSVPQSRSLAPLILGGVLALIVIAPIRAKIDVRIERVRVDLSDDPAFLIECLEGMGGEGARRIVALRRDSLAMDSAEDVIAIKGIGPRLLHRWHDDLAFTGEAP